MHLCIILCVGVGGVPRHIGDYKRTIWTWGWDLGQLSDLAASAFYPLHHHLAGPISYPPSPITSDTCSLQSNSKQNRAWRENPFCYLTTTPHLWKHLQDSDQDTCQGTVSEGANSAYLNQSSLLTTAAISAPVLWFKAASTIEAIKKKKVLSPVLTKS